MTFRLWRCLSIKRTFNIIASSITFKRLPRRFDIGVWLRVILGGGVSSLIVNPDIICFSPDLSSLLLLLVSVSRRLSRSSDIGVSLLLSVGGCSSVFAFCSHLIWCLLFLSFCLFVFLSFCLFVLLSFCPFVFLSFCQVVLLSICAYFCL